MLDAALVAQGHDLAITTLGLRGEVGWVFCRVAACQFWRAGPWAGSTPTGGGQPDAGAGGFRGVSGFTIAGVPLDRDAFGARWA